MDVTFCSLEEVKTSIKLCEGRHIQQVAYSSYHDALTQICFDCKKVRTSLKYKEPKSEFLEVKLSDAQNVLLEDKSGNILVETWSDEKNLNDFDYFKKNNRGPFWINGDFNKFEFLYKNKWLKCDERMEVRFLR